ncbi:MAG TPA: hypothetical protein VHN77_03050 [Phycisphaerales bacterium]|nr:hypothetical protein [Phycisphaerales bacterium]
MRSRRTGAIAAASGLCAGLAFGALAQDSVSTNANGGNGMPGDALSPWAGGASQRSNYVVDLTTFQTSWGTQFGIAPIVKSGKIGPARFNAVNGPSCISPTLKVNTAYPAASYSRWTAPGGGMNAAENNAGLNTTIAPTGTASVFGVAVLDLDEAPIASSASNAFINQLVGAQVAFDPANPARLHVTRVAAAVNAASTQGDRSQFGMGAIDADGNLVFRADGFGAAGPTANILVGDNYFRVRLPARNTSLNLIDNAGGGQAAATDWVLVRSGNLTAAPGAIPADQAGRSVVLGADFIGNLMSETSALTLTSTNTHRPSTLDHRAGASFSPSLLFPGTVGTGAMISRSSGGTGKADAMSVFGLTSGGAVSGARTIVLPSSVTDACDTSVWSLSGGDLRQYDSQVTFRGGSGPVAVGKDFDGRALMAGTVYNGSQLGSNAPINAIVAARFDPTNGASTVTWTNVAWVATSGSDGKDIRGDFGADGAPGTSDAGEGDGLLDAAPIGRIAAMSEGPTGYQGPSLSAPAFDAAGNIWFIASVALRKWNGTAVVDEYDTALLRAVYDPANFCYSLELVAEPGMVFAGQNSGRNYRLDWLGLADSDSVSSASLWSGSVMGQAWNNASTALLAPKAPQHLGGLVLSARVVYDRDQNGVYSDPTSPGGDVNSADEGYNVVLYVGNVLQPGNVCDSIDFNNDGLFPDTLDIDDFLSVFSGGPCSNDPNCGDIDFNNDGLFPDTLDIDALLSIFSGGPCL